MTLFLWIASVIELNASVRIRVKCVNTADDNAREARRKSKALLIELI